MVLSEKLYMVEEFWGFLERPENADRKFELINGVIIEDMSPSFSHGRYASHIYLPLALFVNQHDLGEVVFEVDHYIPPDHFNTRRPDVEFMSKARLAQFDPNKYVPLMPDLAVEVKSPTNSFEELRQKAAYYLQNGTAAVWLIYPENQTVVVYTLTNPDGQSFGIDDSLTGEPVLPGFALPLKDIFR